MINRTLVSIVLLFQVNGAIANAGETVSDLKRSFTLSSGYVERAYNSNEGLSAFPLSLIQLYSKGFDSVVGTPETMGSRVLATVIDLPVSFWFAHSLFVPFHEFGHARVSLSQGINYTYSTSAYGETASGISNFWELSFYRLFTPPFGFPGAGKAALYPETYPLTNSLSAGLNQHYGTSGLNIIFSAAGLNNQVLLSKKVGDLIYLQNGHITYFQHYLGNKISPFVYSQIDRSSLSLDSDIRAILNSYQLKGYNISQSSIETQSLISLLSGTTASFIVAYAHFISTGNPTVRSLEIAGIRVPDINGYINARGLSYEFVTGYRVNENLRFDLSYETIFNGDTEHQITPRAHYQLASVFPSLNDFWISSDLVIGAGMGGSIEAKWAPYLLGSDSQFFKKLSYFAKFTHYNAYTLYGERNIPFAKNQDTSNEVLLGLNYRY